ncbi:hypothetical protein QCA50_000460 [Cerrena zonata]|uniref:STB6-like N-terminal domain-containing protein n=1 Tax=Cerrena zonata TaxID=2478898 RepID=A0AAW0GUP0_9APHY
MTSHPPQRPRVVTSSAYLAVPADSGRSLSASPASSPETSPLIPSAPPQWTIPNLPTISRANSHARSISQSLASPIPTPPYLMSQGSASSITRPRRLLMPTVRPSTRHIQPHFTSLKTPVSAKASPARLGRSRAGSLATGVTNTPDLSLLAPPTPVDWIGGGCRFEVVEDQLELEGYQIYAVEKWVAERRRPVTVLTVYTGNPKHRIIVTVLSPSSTLLPAEQMAEWDKAIYQLRRDGAKPRETDKGTVMITSLANFRSDYTIVHIPRGNFLDIREQLYANIDVLRMGCSGRSALTLEEPSDTTKDRFISAYHFPEKTLTRGQQLFNPTVLELVKIIQASLAICGMFDLAPDERNGLLCDVTCEGIQRWIAEIGEPCMEVEPTERVADPSVVAALLSMVLATRNKLHALGYAVPKDPFIDPHGFIKSLAAFQSSSKPHNHDHKHSLSLSHNSYSLTHPSSSTLPSGANTPSGSFATIPTLTSSLTYLNRALIRAIQVSFDKFKQSESYKVHKVLINKLDDLATDLRTNPEAHSRSGGWGGLWSNVYNNPTTDLDALVRVVFLSGNSKESASSLRYLWTGRPEELMRKRKEKELSNDNEERGIEAKAEKEAKDREKSHEKEREREKASEDEGELIGGKPWSGRVQRKIESWAALGRSKKLSTDLGSKGKPLLGLLESPTRGNAAGQSTVPRVIVSRDPVDEEDLEVLSSGQVSPVSDSQVRHPISLGAIQLAAHSTSEISSDYDRRVSEFNHKRHPMKPQYQTRVISWSDPVTARDIIDEPGDKKRGPSPLSKNTMDGMEVSSMLAYAEDSTEDLRRAKFLRGRRSFDDADKLKGTRILPVEHMRTDVDLCGQLLVMYRREQHLANVLMCIQALTQTLSNSNAALRSDYEEHQHGLAEVDARAAILLQIEALRTKADAMTQETNALAYESAQFRVDDLYQTASQPRIKVLELREKVFGTGRRLRQGVHGAHGQFNRVQWTIDGEERLVDMWGRTESEAEEELELPGAHVLVQEDDEPEVVEHPSLRPTWVLSIFNYLGGKWGSLGKDHKPNGNTKSPTSGPSSPQVAGEGATSQKSDQALSSSVELVDARSAFSRHYTD